MVWEVGGVYREVESNTFIDWERFANRPVDHVQSRTVDAVAPHIAKRSSGWGSVRTYVVPPFHSVKVSGLRICDLVREPRES